VGQTRIVIADLLFDNVDLPQAVAVVERALARGTRGYIVPANVDLLLQHRENPATRTACDAAALRVADGMPIVWASRLLGRPLLARVTGADLVPALCGMAARRGHSVFLLGGRTGVADRAAARLAARFPGLRVAGTHTPPDLFAPEGAAAEAAVRAVNAVRPALLFVGLGAPKQELWVHRHWERLDTTVALCCGAALDFAAGVRPRAPAWIQRAGAEWAWRLAHEPRRLWKRYLVRDAAFLGILLKEWWSARNRVFER
jgi:N-acetylglucosaminyldiphosphoundecaprenol N-acetyl-beta-D-mannosaminyltransferase